MILIHFSPLYRTILTPKTLNNPEHIRDLGNNRIVDIEDNAISGAGAGGGGGGKAERVVFVLLENDQCSGAQTSKQSGTRSEDACSLAPKVAGTDSPCYNGGSCISSSILGARGLGGYSEHTSSNYSCLCPPGFTGSLCEVNIDDCAEHQCQNGAMCVDGVNSYKCACRDPTTSGEFCEQLNSYASNSENAIAPMALPIVAPPRANQLADTNQQQQQQILARSADLLRPPVELSHIGERSNCKRLTHKRYYEDGNGCRSVRMLKLSECVGSCAGTVTRNYEGKKGAPTTSSGGCCMPAQIKRKRIRMQCTDGASYLKTVELIKKCSCSSECSNAPSENLPNATQEESQFIPITRLDAVD